MTGLAHGVLLSALLTYPAVIGAPAPGSERATPLARLTRSMSESPGPTHGTPRINVRPSRAGARHGPASVSPQGGGGITAATYSNGNVVTFFIQNTDWNAEYYSLYCWTGGSVSSCSSAGSVYVDGYGAAWVDVTYSTSYAGAGTVGLWVGGFGEGGWYDITVADAMSPPTISLAPHNGTLRDVSRCVADCFENTLSYSTPAYISLDVPRSVTLMYRSGQARPLGRVEIDATDPSPTPAEKMSLRLLRPNQQWVTFTNGQQELFFAGGGGTVRLVAQFEASDMVTGAHNFTAVVTSYWPGNTRQSSTPIRVMIINESASPLGSGWAFAGVQRTYVQPGDGVVITDGSGSAAFFAGSCAGSAGACTFAPPAGEFSTLTWDGYLYVRRYPDGAQLYFRPDGTLAHTTDRFQNYTVYTYSGGKLTQIMDAVAQSTIIGYEDGSGGGKVGTLRYIATPGGRTAWFGVDAANDLLNMVDVDGTFFGTANYSGHRLGNFRDRRGGDWTFTYNADGTLASAQAPTVNVSTGATRPTGTLSGPSTRIFAAIAQGYGTSGSPVARYIDLRATITNPRGHATHYTINHWGAPTYVARPAPSVGLSFEYDATTGQLIRSVEGSGVRDVRYTWNGPRLTKVWDVATGQTVNASYETTYNQPDRIWGNVVEQWFYYDATKTGKPLVSSRSGISNAPLTTYSVDSRGRTWKVVDPAGHSETIAFEPGGLQNTASTTRPGFRTTTFRRDGFGRVVRVFNADGSKDSTVYDALNRQRESIDGATRRTRYDFDGHFLRSVTDPKGQTYSFSRNALGWIDQESRPGSLPLVYRYDPNGNVVSTTNRRGQTVAYMYNALDQDTLRIAPGDTARYSYVTYYSPSLGIAGYVVGKNAASTDTIFFDSQGRVKRTTTVRGPNWYSLAFSYNYGADPASPPHGTLWKRDATSNRWSGTKTIAYGYNAVGAVHSIFAFGQHTTRTLNNENLTSRINYPNGLVNEFRTTSTHDTYSSTFLGTGSAQANTQLGVQAKLDGGERVQEWRRAVGDSLRGFQYGFERWLTHRHIFAPGQHTCSFDVDFGYTCSSFEPLSHSEPFAYDDAGTLMNGVTQLDPGNRVRIASGVSYDYDADGNVVRKVAGDNQTLVWDALGQLVQVTASGYVSNVEFKYDAFGRRVSKYVVSGIPSGPYTTGYVYEGDNLFMEVNASGTPYAEYSNWPGIDNPHSVIRYGQQYYFAWDPVSGSVRGLTRASDKWPMSYYGYTPYGQNQGGHENSGGNPIQFQGRPLDTETGFYYFRARFYDPQVGRFLSEDPIGIRGGTNLYSFAGNDPVNGSDPYGLVSDDCGQNVIQVVFGGVCFFYRRIPGPTLQLPKPLVGPEHNWSSPQTTTRPSSENGGPVWFVGVGGSAILGGGPTGGVGVWADGYRRGVYGRFGWGWGTDAGGGVEGGRSASLDAFRDRSDGLCGGYFKVEGCFAWNASGTTLTGTVGPVTPGGHFEATHTYAIILSRGSPLDGVRQFIREARQFIDYTRGLPRWAAP
jgi:RHS repeat-associated protein